LPSSGQGLRRAVGEGALLVILSAGIAFGSNARREKPLPLLADPRVLALEVDVPIISAKEALEGFEAGELIFLDARPYDVFTTSHVGGAFSVPAEEFGERYTIIGPLLSGEAKAVVYGWASAPAAPERLVRTMQEAGIENIVFLIDGFEGWLRLDAPVEKGDDPTIEVLDQVEAGEEEGS
jgi:rhodanese-related sulfurtransferase